jgi:molecular chaperone DnaK
MASFIGIDLGTTYSAVSYIDDTGRSKIVHNSEGSNITPSCIDFADGKAVVGEGARRSLGLSDTIASRFKRDMDSSKTYSIEGDEYTPTDCSAIVLKKLLQDTKAAIGEVGEAVVTIPANFANEARNATMNAAKQAGLDIKYIINEPTAAALYYAFQSGDGLHGYYAVYDLGGGTFDVTILKVEGQDVEVVTSGGITRLGGDDFDTVLQQIVQKKYKEKNGEDPEEGDYTKTNAEDDKKSLSKRDKVKARVVRTNIKVTREEFEQEISSLVAQTEMLCESIIDEAGIKVSDIQEVFLAGGSTRMPVVLESIRRVFKKDPVASVNVDEVVALGASLYAAYKGDQSKLSKTQQNSIKRIRVAEVTQKCFGFISMKYDENRGEDRENVSVLIQKNEKIPCSVTRSFYTKYEGQVVVSCRITEASDSTDDPRFVNVKASYELPLPANRPAGQEIEVTYSFDDSQIMHASFVDVESAKKKEIKLSVIESSEGGLNKIDKFIVE